MLVEATSKAFPLNEEALRKWAKREGIFLHPEAAFLVKTQTMGMGVFARKGIGKGQTVISCPHTAYIAPMDEAVNNAPAAAAIAQYRFNTAALLSGADVAASTNTKTNVNSENATAAATTCEDRLDDWTRTVLRLMAEVVRADSPWRTWLQCCPRMPDSLFSVSLPTTAAASSEAGSSTSHQQEVLFGLPDFLKKGADANGKAQAHAIISGPAQQLSDLDIEKKWLLSKPLLEAYPSIWPPTLPAHCNALPLSPAQQQAQARAAAAAAPVPTSVAPRLKNLRDLFLECAAQVTSRNFHRESQDRPGPYLLPTIDFLNHSADRKNVDFQIHGGGGGKRHVTFDVIATRDILPKEQIFHDYGALSAARFLVEFQFVLHPKSLQQDESLRWSKEALSTLVALLYTNGNKAAGHTSEAHGTLSFEKKYQQCLNRCNYLIKNDLFLFEEGVILSGGKNEGVGGGDGNGAAGSGSTFSSASVAAAAGGAVTNAAASSEVDLKAATVIDYASGKAIPCTVAHQRNGATTTGGGQEARTEAAKRAERKALELTYLHNTLFLLSVTDVCFDGVKPFLSRHWSVMDIPRNRRDLESTGAGQRVVVELGCPLMSQSSYAAASSSPAAAPAPAGPAPTNLTSPIADGLTLAAVPHYGAFSSPSFKVGPTVLKEISSDRLAKIVTETLMKPFIAAYEAVLEYQLDEVKKGPSSATNNGSDANAKKVEDEAAATSAFSAAASFSAFPTPRTADMTGNVLAHELHLTKTVASLLVAQQ